MRLTPVQIAILGGCFLVVLIAVWFEAKDREHKRIEAFLGGDDSLTIISITVTGQGQSFEIADDESMNYLNERFQRSRRERDFPRRFGLSYRADVSLGDGSSFETLFEIVIGSPPDFEEVRIGYPLDTFGDPKYYRIRIPKPMPSHISDLVRRLRKED